MVRVSTSRRKLLIAGVVRTTVVRYEIGDRARLAPSASVWYLLNPPATQNFDLQDGLGVGHVGDDRVNMDKQRRDSGAPGV
jgi:hypothetical protein